MSENINELWAYVASIVGYSNEIPIVSQNINDHSDWNDGMYHEYKQGHITFANGVVIEQIIEHDHLPENEPDENICEECWISYRVVGEPDMLSIRPKQKYFVNHCQQAFWLKISQPQPFVVL
ncbi:hypothetical protein [Celerinatantimonas sp. YJH-8]|uniref:hypothetical protein n=1 Tax=Celerinatantimonas sp. YJH-8 TaxID=3228714 RepID=UPI0038C11B0B